MKYRLTIYFANGKEERIEMHKRIDWEQPCNSIIIQSVDKGIFINLDHVLEVIEEKLPEENENPELMNRQL